jgi:hypothetical protein
MKPKTKPSEKPETKSLGTILSEKHRASANKDTDEQRAASIAQGISIIYGGVNSHAKTANRR